MEEKLLYKPNQLIMSTHKDITITQKKAYNYILFEAREQLKKNPDQRYFEFAISDIKKNAGIDTTNNKRLKDDLVALMTTAVELVQDDDWDIFPLLTRAKKSEGHITVGLEDIIRDALISNSYYTTLNLLEISRLSGKYAVILYEVYLRYRGKEIPYMTIDEFKQLTGTTEVKSYENFARLKAKVIEVAIEEIRKELGVSLSYTTKTKGRKVIGIKFKFERASQPKKEIVEADIVSSDIGKFIEKVKRNLYISKAWNKRADTKIQKVLRDQGEEYTKDLLERAYEGCKSDIKTTLVQYFNGIMKNMKEEVEEATIPLQVIDLKIEEVEKPRKEIKSVSISQEVKEYKKDIDTLAKKQMDSDTYWNFKAKLTPTLEVEAINQLVVEYGINRPLKGMEV